MLALRPSFLPAVHCGADGTAYYAPQEKLVGREDEYPLRRVPGEIENRETNVGNGAGHDGEDEK